MSVLFRGLVTTLVVNIFFISISEAQSANEWESGQRIYSKVCVYCHQQGPGPTITGKNFPADYIKTIARNGHNAMPAFKPSELSERDLDLLAEYLLSLEKGN